jgi:hypothetical protein
MKKSIFCVLSAAAVMGAALTSTAASAEVDAPPTSSASTIVTFTVSGGALMITAPATAYLGSGAPGTTISGTLAGASDPPVDTEVTDDRALLVASWTVSVSETDFTTGGATPAETIPATDATYTAGAFTTTGTITVVATPPTLPLSNTSTPDILGTLGVGDNTATWNPTIAVAVPADAVGGLYTGTLTQSVS